MPSLSIKNVPEPVVEKLRQRAQRNHRSMQRELMAVLCEAVSAEEISPVAARREAATKPIEQIAAEHRARWASPFTQGQRAVALIRADRDAR